MCSSIFVIWMERLTWKFSEHMYVRFFNLCSSIICTSTSRAVYSRLAKYHFFGGFVGIHSARPDSEKIKAITNWPVPADAKILRKFLVLLAYLQKYSRNYAEMTVHLSCLLNKYQKWSWNADYQRCFEQIRQSLK